MLDVKTASFFYFYTFPMPLAQEGMPCTLNT